MPVNLSIKNVPDDLAERLRRRAAASHRSLQGELLSIMEQALNGEEGRPLTIEEAVRRIRKLGIRTADESVEILRADRDAR